MVPSSYLGNRRTSNRIKSSTYVTFFAICCYIGRHIFTLVVVVTLK